MRAHGLMLVILAVLAVVPSAAGARDMKLTIYDDGRSCPGGCDAHVVINAADNGTRYAFRPDAQRNDPRPCINGQTCRICFGEDDTSCMTVLYRGAGPPVGTFDFTPAFYDRTCPEADLPKALREQCTSLDRATNKRGYSTAINCIANPTHTRCTEIIANATARYQADRLKRDQCLSLGEAKYNARQSDPKERRSNACNYSQARLGGPNSKGIRWRLLLPAACREGTFAGRHGLDCCSSNARFAASVHPECSAYFPALN